MVEKEAKSCLHAINFFSPLKILESLEILTISLPEMFFCHFCMNP